MRDAAAHGPPRGSLNEYDCVPVEEHEETEATPHTLVDRLVCVEVLWVPQMREEGSESDTVHARDASASRQQCAGVMRTEMHPEAKAMAVDGVYWANAERCLLLASTGGIWICGYVLLGERGAGRFLLGHGAALPAAPPNAGLASLFWPCAGSDQGGA